MSQINDKVWSAFFIYAQGKNMIDSLLSHFFWFQVVVFTGGFCVASFIFYLSRQRLLAKNHELQITSTNSQNEVLRLNRTIEQLNGTLNHEQTEKMTLHGQCQQYHARLSEKQSQLEHTQKQLQQSEKNIFDANKKAHQYELELTDLRITLEQKQLSFEAQIVQLENAKQQLKQEFENIANQIFEEKTTRFTTQSQATISQILKPVQGELKGFRDKMEAIHSEELKQRASLKTELLHLQANNKNITEQAHKLTTALQGQKKTQGNWGELMLENVLDSAGLRAGYDYKREVSFNTDDGKYRPDVIVYLPQERHLVIDAKTSLNAYTRYVNAQSEVDAEHALVEHSQAVAARIKELGDKSYERLPGLNSPEVVVLFIPIESAFVEALKHNPTLYQQALEQNILVATPTTLLTSLNIVKQLWRFEEQSKHSRELALRAEKFYNKLNTFLNSMEGVGKQLDKAKESFDKSLSQLYTGKGNLIKQAAEFKDLGVSVTKEIPNDLTEKARLELD